MSHVVLVNPPSPFLIQENVHGPLGLWYLGAALKAVGHSVSYADLCLGDEIPDDGDIYGVTGTTPQLGAMLRIIADLYAAGKHVIAGGPHATIDPQPLLDAGAQVVVQGEGEEAIFTALAMIANSNDPNLVYEPGLLQAPRIKDLDTLPFPDRSRAHEYHYEIMDRKGVAHRATTAISSRGCNSRCAFCCHSLWGNAVRMRSAANVVAEARELRDKHGFSAIHYFDDSIAISRRRLLDICAGLAPLGLTWRAFVRADQLDPTVLGAMAAAGCCEIGLGIESGSDRILQHIQKGESVASMRTAIAWAKRAAIRVKAFLICGLPGETWESVDETAAFLQETQPDEIDVTVLAPYKGAPLYDHPWQYDITMSGQASEQWYKGRKGEYQCHHRTAGMSEDDILIARDYLAARFGKR